MRAIAWIALASAFLVAGLTSTDASAGKKKKAATATLVGKARLAKDANQQVDPLLRPYLSSDGGVGKGDLWLELCSDAACASVVGRYPAADAADYVFTSGFPKDFSVPGLPVGTFWARVGIDSARSTAYGDPLDAAKGFGPFDVLQSAGADPRPSAGKNPTPGTVKVVLTAGGTVDLGTAVLGTLLTPKQTAAAATEKGWLFAAASGTGPFRNAVKIIDTATWALKAPAVPQLDGKDLEGDICGFVRGPDAEMFVIAVGSRGGYVYSFDTGTRKFASGAPVWIPHPDCKDGTCPAKPDPENYPWLCRGSVGVVGGEKYLFLSDYKGAGAQPSANGAHAAVVRVTGLAAGAGSLVAVYGTGSPPFLTSRRVLRHAQFVGGKVYFVEPSWSRALADDKLPKKTHLWAVPVASDGKLDWAARTGVVAGTADDTCGSTNNWVPGLAVAGGRLFLGNDGDISVYDAAGSLLGAVDTRAYGTLPTSFAISPAGDRLYAAPNCKSATTKAKMKAGFGGTKRVTLDRHAVVVLDLGGAGVPKLADTGRDFDEDGLADGGVDLEFLHLKAKLLRWCSDCSGVVPPTTYTGPEIVVGTKVLVMRGTGIQGNGSTTVSSSGLGQPGDVALFGLADGRGAVLRAFDVWTDGPSSRWGFDLDPANPKKDYSGDVSVGALAFVPR